MLPLGFGALTAVGMLLAARARPEHVHPLLLAGAAMLGAGLLAAAPADGHLGGRARFAVAALGAGLVTALGFPYFARFVPDGEAGSYSGLFFAGRAVASAAALPLAGLAVELSGGYRAVLWLGAAALAAVVPLLARGERRGRTARAGAAHGPPAWRRSSRSTRRRAPPRWHGRRSGTSTRWCWSTMARRLRSRVRSTSWRPTNTCACCGAAHNGGKGSALSAGVAPLLGDPHPPEAIVVLDSDGQHDPARIPAFVDAERRATS